jgi:type IV secretion system protein VirB2
MSFEPTAPNAFAAAVQWLESTILGTVATAIAVIAVASVGFLLLSGRVDVRRAAQVIFGCFILFGASSIAAGIMRAVNADGSPAEIQAAPLPPPIYPPAAPQTRPAAAAYDPYAGAALPSR